MTKSIVSNVRSLQFLASNKPVFTPFAITPKSFYFNESLFFMFVQTFNNKIVATVLSIAHDFLVKTGLSKPPTVMCAVYIQYIFQSKTKFNYCNS